MNKKILLSGTTVVVVLATVLAVFAWRSSLVQATVSKKSTVIDLTKLPLGDKKTTTSGAKVGYEYTCRDQRGGGGSMVDGPWIHGDTWDYTAKLQVSGSIAWPLAKMRRVRSGEIRTITGNGLPVSNKTGIFPIPSTDAVHQYDGNPNSIKAQTIKYELPANPTLLSTPQCVGGMVGIAINGVTLFNAVDGEGRDAVAHEAQDLCDGHPESNGTYHYHDLSRCLADPGAAHSRLLGYALDGFGIYGFRGEGGKELTNDDLDECHGHTHEITWDGKKVTMYHYHATHEFPYLVGCFKGKPISVQQSAPTNSGQPQNGSTMSPPPGRMSPPPSGMMPPPR